MLLTSTSDIVRVTTTTVSVLNIQVSWADQTTTTFTPGRTNTIISSASTTTIVGSPASSTQRQIKNITINNTDASNVNNVTVQHYDGSNYVTMVHTNLLAGYSLQYTWDNGWSTLDNNGNILTSVGTNAAGSSNQIQFNNGNNFLAGDSDFTWNSGTNEFGLNGTNTSILTKGIITEPSAPGSGVLRIYSRATAGRMLPKWIGPAGLNTAFQPGLFSNNIIFFSPYTSTTVTPNGFGAIWAKGGGAGTVATPTPSITAPTFLNSMKRITHTNAAGTANQAMGIISTAAGSPQFWRGNAAGLGGWFFFARFGLAGYITGSRVFAGLTAGTAEVVASDTVAANTAGVWISGLDTGNNMWFVTKDAATTNLISITGATLTSGSTFDVYMFARPNDSTVYYRVDQLDNGAGVGYGTIADSSTTNNLPVNTVFLGPQVEMSNGTAFSNTGIASISTIAINRIYVESDH